MKSINLIEAKRRGKTRALVLGLGKSGKSVSRLLNRKGFNVHAVDENISKNIIGKIEELESLGIKGCCGTIDDYDISESDFVVASPGFSPAGDALKKAKAFGIPVLSEIETAWQFLNSKPKTAIFVTGTNGKSTVVSLIGEMAELEGKTVIAGNIGKPLSAEVSVVDGDTILVVEISSFQLYFSFSVKPDISILLNISPDHLDWHVDFKDYLLSKEKLLKLTKKGGYSILNRDDKRVYKLKNSVDSSLVWFSKKFIGSEKNIAFLKNGEVNIKLGESVEKIISRNDFKLLGAHNTENLLASVSAARVAGFSLNTISDAVNSFKPLPHRMERVFNAGKIYFIDDSKATNPESTMRAIEDIEVPFSIILGGKAKNTDFSGLAKVLSGKTVICITMGDAAAEIEKTLRFEKVRYLRAKNMEGAVFKSIGALLYLFNNSISLKELKNIDETDNEKKLKLLKLWDRFVQEKEGEGYILLSPACASFDMYKNYKQRGNDFSKQVKKLFSVKGVS